MRVFKVKLINFSKLDLTLNFIDLEDFEQSMKNLSKNLSNHIYNNLVLREIYLVGNPCAEYRNF